METVSVFLLNLLESKIVTGITLLILFGIPIVIGIMVFTGKSGKTDEGEDAAQV
jgi:hypothetical protein